MVITRRSPQRQHARPSPGACIEPRWTRSAQACAAVVAVVLTLAYARFGIPHVGVIGSEKVTPIDVEKSQPEEGDRCTNVASPLTWSLVAGERVLLASPSRENTIGTVLLFHGCTNNAETWRDAPLERELVLQLRHSNFRIVALSSASNAIPGSSQCWGQEPDERTNVDLRRTFAVLTALQQQSPQGHAFIGVGASSGGSFVSLFAAARPGTLRALAVYISPLHPGFMDTFARRQALPGAARLRVRAGGEAEGADERRDEAPLQPTAALVHDGAPPARVPPALMLVHMGHRDRQTAMVIAEQSSELRLAFADAMQLRVAATGALPPPLSRCLTSSDSVSGCIQARSLPPRPLSALGFSSRMPGRLTARASTAMFQHLVREGVLAPWLRPDANPHRDSGDGQGLAEVAVQPRLRRVREAVGQFVDRLEWVHAHEPSGRPVEGHRAHTAAGSGKGNCTRPLPRTDAASASLLLPPGPLASPQDLLFDLPKTSAATRVGQGLESPALRVVGAGPNEPGRPSPAGSIHAAAAVDFATPPAGETGASAAGEPGASAAAGRQELVRWILEVLNEAYAEHEMTDRHAGDVAAFLAAQV